MLITCQQVLSCAMMCLTLLSFFTTAFFVTNALFLLKNTILRIVEHWILGTFAMKKSHLSVKKRTLHVSLL